jgi:hypothetical protein
MAADTLKSTNVKAFYISLLVSLLLLEASSLFFGLTASIFFANSTTFGLESIWLNCSIFGPSLIIIIPFFLVKVDPAVVVFVGFISIAIDDGLFLDAGNLPN